MTQRHHAWSPSDPEYDEEWDVTVGDMSDVSEVLRDLAANPDVLTEPRTMWLTFVDGMAVLVSWPVSALHTPSDADIRRQLVRRLQEEAEGTDTED
jgi:hypothetical protein